MELKSGLLWNCKIHPSGKRKFPSCTQIFFLCYVFIYNFVWFSILLRLHPKLNLKDVACRVLCLEQHLSLRGLREQLVILIVIIIYY